MKKIIFLICIIIFTGYGCSRPQQNTNPLQELIKTIGGETNIEPDYLEWVYIDNKSYLYYEIIDSGTAMATITNGLISLENYEHFYTDYLGSYAGLKDKVDTILPEVTTESKNLKLEKNKIINNFLKNRLFIEKDGRILLTTKQNTYEM